MSSKKAVILVDGQNLFYGLRDIGILEKDIIWDKLFQSFLEKDEDLLRTSWFRPQRLFDSHFTYFGIRNKICYRKYKNHIHNYTNKDTKHLVPQHIIDDIENEAAPVESWLKFEQEKFAKIQYNYDQIGLEYGDIEFVKTGIVKIDPFNQSYIGEKGVDISLAVKMIALSVEKRCDKIILVSGDFDYAEAIKFVKNNMTKIHLVKFHKGFPPQNRSVSRDLAVLSDKVIDVYESNLRSNFVKNAANP